jgi:hypothetical protein
MSYDPPTGVLRSSSVDDIAAWFLDTNYDGDAFFISPVTVPTFEVRK